ncbi:MAG: HEAT repeat domain-containing protein [Planctomycetota bacterium]
MAWHYRLLEQITAEADPALADHPSVDRALAAAWSSAEPGGRGRLVASMLGRGGPAGAEALIRRRHELDAVSRAALAERAKTNGGNRDLTPALRRVLKGPDAQGRMNAIEMIADAGDGALADLLIDRLHDPNDDVRAAAGRALLSLTDRVEAMTAGEVVQGGGGIRGAQRLVEAAARAVERFAHHQNLAALEAWCVVADRGLAAGGGVVEALQDPEHAAVGKLRELLRTAATADQATATRRSRGLVPALAFAPLALAAVEGLRGLAAAGGEAMAEALNGREHLLDLPAVRRGLSRAADPAGLVPAEQEFLRFPGGIGGVWIDALPLSAHSKAERWCVWLDAAETDTATDRLAVLRRLLAVLDAEPKRSPTRSAAAGTLARRAADPDAAVARLAVAWSLASGNLAAAERDGVMHAASRSPRPAVRRLVERRLGAEAFDRLWRAWPRMDTAQRVAAARAALRTDPTARARLDSQLHRGGLDRERALEIVVCVQAPADAGRSKPAQATPPGQEIAAR